ncbi:hypothetical protein M0R45_028338 [Rubus argutus]|uniref:Uncharacterized protein n=1 Tax=Rubus argutus TaxID=59490 RepID=A0AAW1W742_RUBAR
MSQPPKFFLQVNINCECKGCSRKLKATIPKFQREIAVNHGLRNSSFYLESGRRAIVEVIGDVDRSKQEALQEHLHEFIKKGSSNTTSELCCGCFWKPKKKKCTTSEAQLNDQLKNMSINNNNAGKVNNESEKDDGKASQQQQQRPDANSKRKGKNKIGEDGKGSPVSPQGKQIKGETSETMNQMGEESSQTGQYPRNLTTGESSQNNDQMGRRTKAEYYPMDHTGINPMCQMGQMNGGYYQQPAHVPQTSPFSDDTTADGCTIM